MKTDRNAEFAGLLDAAARALAVGDYAAAQRETDLAIVIDDADARAWELRAAAAAGKPGPAVPRMEEAVNAWLTAEKNAAPDVAVPLRARIAEQYESLYLSEIRSYALRFSASADAGALQRILEIYATGLRLLNALTVQADVIFNCGQMFTRIARIFSDAAADGYARAVADFGPSRSNMQLWQWEKFTDACDGCLLLLSKAVHCCRDHALGKSICDAYIKIGEAVRDSGSWKYNPQSNTYERELAFTAEAKRIRTEDVKTFRARRGYFEADQINRLCRDLESDRLQADLHRGREAYWREHAEEADRLNRENQTLEVASRQAMEQIENLPASVLLAQAVTRQTELQKQISTLGFGKRKEKRALRQSLETLSLRLSTLKAEEAEQKKALTWTVKKSNARLAEIRRIFAAPREALPAPAGTFFAVGADGAVLSPQALCGHLADILPSPYCAAEIRHAEAELSTSFERFGDCFLCEIRKSTDALSKQHSDVRLFLFAPTVELPLGAALLQAPSAVDADETDLHDFAYIGSCLLLSLLDSVSQPEAERLILSMRHGNGETVLTERTLRCTFTQSERERTDGETQIFDLVFLRMLPDGSGVS